MLLLALLIRGGVLLARFDHLAADPDGYRALAHNVIKNGVLGSGQKPSAYRPPLYPLLLAACSASPWKSETAIGVLHLALGVATILLTVDLGRRWGLGHFAYLAGALVACDPILLNQSTLVMTETLATFLAVTSLWCTTATAEATGRRRIAFAAATGMSFAIAALCRPTFLVSLLFIAAGLGRALPRGRERWRTLAAMCIAASIGLLPWAARNWVQFGKPVVTTTHGGYTLLLGNNPAYYDFLETSPWRAVWNANQLDEELRAARGGDEVANDRDEYVRAWQTIRQLPTTFFYASLHRIAALWGVLPHQVSANESTGSRYGRYAIAVWYLAVFGLALAALGTSAAQVTRPPWLWAALLAASFTAVHLVYWTDMRMRAPLTPAISLLAAAGVRRLADRRRALQHTVM
ncbi:MAG TPA: glycosyltransferase family 39 protein [Pirellulales bacterium]|nr:glycosyltransferase family 39 protein [Pirellulales bacterium]